MVPGFISYKQETALLIDSVIQDSTLHGLWLNTLSYLENCGARKIASCEHPTQVKEEMLKHASEESRHAFHLKKQLARIDQSYEDYRISSLLAGWKAHNYLNGLDLKTCKYLKSLNLNPSSIRQLAYLLVTYSIELRAEEFYFLYQSALRQKKSKVQVQSIVLEEKEHLAEMEKELSQIPNSSLYVKAICAIEAVLFHNWLEECSSIVFAKVS
jgi:hypothetical protein